MSTIDPYLRATPIINWAHPDVYALAQSLAVVAADMTGSERAARTSGALPLTSSIEPIMYSALSG